MLLAVGLPACWTAQSSAPAPPAAPVAAEPERTRVAEFDPDRCPRDTVPETICGHKEEGARCGPRGDSVESIEDSDLHVTGYSNRRAFRGFVFDLGATHGYQDRLHESGEDVAGACCYSRCTKLVVGTAGAQVAPPGHHLDERCIPPPPNGTSVPEPTNQVCPAGVAFDGALRPYASASDESCCYTTIRPNYRAIPGRALRIDGEPAAAAAIIDGAWLGAGTSPRVDLDADTRQRLAAIWLEAARLEHASIAAFSMLSLRLLALGAPPSLVARTHAAALDEIEHARLAFELATAYAGAPRGPDAFTDVARAAPACDLATLAVETLLDGCMNETVAALEAEVAAARCEDPAVAAVLAKIADDEARHAELAFAIVRWCVELDPGLGATLRASLATIVLPAPGLRAAHLEPHGVLADATLVALRAEVLRDVVAPCVAALAAG